jgi:hypothetical protein
MEKSIENLPDELVTRILEYHPLFNIYKRTYYKTSVYNSTIHHEECIPKDEYEYYLTIFNHAQTSIKYIPKSHIIEHHMLLFFETNDTYLDHF